MEELEIKTIDEYIGQYPPDIQQKLQAVRQVIKETAPQAQEKISWRMPTFFWQGNLVHFAGHKGHIGLYPGAEAIEAFREQLKEYETSKGAVQLPYSKPLPLALIREIVLFRLAATRLEEERRQTEKQAASQASKKKNI